MASPLMRIPTELRLMIYAYLFDAGNTDTDAHEGYYPNSDGGVKQKRAKQKIISIRNGRQNLSPWPGLLPVEYCIQCGQYVPPARRSRPRTRSRYQVMGGTFARRYYETTYYLENKGAYFYTALMSVNRKIYAETSHLVYADHVFHFGANIEAVKPFLSDLTPGTRALVKKISLYKRGPWVFHGWSDRCEWEAMCTYLCEYASVEHLRLIMQAGRLPETEKREWEQWKMVETAPRQLSRQDVALLVGIRHAMLDWVEDLFPMKTLSDIEVLPDFSEMPMPQTSDMVVYMALSASIDKGFREFLRERFGFRC
ncbi:hypothetical protein F4801DRAFT_500017 [Xylaria longipes]|nr:hypothetical protein F4801DRAFT_500017 [Xylaria longipes]RYC61242.1 hypothetical protein CHU98_g4958 [Xylaria longipes]